VSQLPHLRRAGTLERTSEELAAALGLPISEAQTSALLYTMFTGGPPPPAADGGKPAPAGASTGGAGAVVATPPPAPPAPPKVNPNIVLQSLPPTLNLNDIKGAHNVAGGGGANSAVGAGDLLSLEEAAAFKSPALYMDMKMRQLFQSGAH